ncbi:hypothetical protein EMIT0158MI4_220044 [Burkholderia ambifaria]
MGRDPARTVSCSTWRFCAVPHASSPIQPASSSIRSFQAPAYPRARGSTRINNQQDSIKFLAADLSMRGARL